MDTILQNPWFIAIVGGIVASLIGGALNTLGGLGRPYQRSISPYTLLRMAVYFVLMTIATGIIVFFANIFIIPIEKGQVSFGSIPFFIILAIGVWITAAIAFYIMVFHEE